MAPETRGASRPESATREGVEGRGRARNDDTRWTTSFASIRDDSNVETRRDRARRRRKRRDIRPIDSSVVETSTRDDDEHGRVRERADGDEHGDDDDDARERGARLASARGGDVGENGGGDARGGGERRDERTQREGEVDVDVDGEDVGVRKVATGT